MAKIVWEGNQDWDKDFPDGRAPAHATRLRRPDDILRASLPYGILPCLLCFACIFYRRNGSASFLFDLRFMPLSFLIGFLSIPLHEFLHAACYPSGATVYVGICLKKVAAYAISFDPISRRRYIAMSLAPMLLGLLPLVILLVCPSSLKALLTVCVVPAFMGLISPAPDYADVAAILRQVPRGASIQASNEGLYWFLPTASR